MKRATYQLWYFFVLCPFFSPLFRFPMDIQPWALIISFLIIAINRKVKTCPYIYYVLFMTFIATGIFLLSLINLKTTFSLVFRKYMNYISFLIVLAAGYNIFLEQDGPKESWIKPIILIWLFVGLLETMFPTVSSLIMPGSRTTEGRGVVGLAMEPSFYGYMAFFFFIIALQFENKKERVLYCFLSIIQIVLMAKSAVSILYFFVFVLIWCLQNFGLRMIKNVKKAIITLLAIFMLVMLFLRFGSSIYNSFKNVRMVRLLFDLPKLVMSFTSIKSLYAIDYSVAERLDSVLSAFKIFLNNVAIPVGFDYSSIGTSGINRIMSGFGSTLCEMGIFGACFVIFTIAVLVKGYCGDLRVVISVAACLFSAVQLSSPTFGFIVSIALYNINQRQSKQENCGGKVNGEGCLINSNSDIGAQKRSQNATTINRIG